MGFIHLRSFIVLVILVHRSFSWKGTSVNQFSSKSSSFSGKTLIQSGSNERKSDISREPLSMAVWSNSQAVKDYQNFLDNKPSATDWTKVRRNVWGGWCDWVESSKRLNGPSCSLLCTLYRTVQATLLFLPLDLICRPLARLFCRHCLMLMVGTL